MNAVSNSVVMYKNGGYDPSTRLLAAICGGGGGSGYGGGRWDHSLNTTGSKSLVLGHANDKFWTYSAN